MSLTALVNAMLFREAGPSVIGVTSDFELRSFSVGARRVSSHADCRHSTVLLTAPDRYYGGMPIRYEIDAIRSLTTIAMTGDVTTADFRAYFEATGRDPSFRPTLNRLITTQGVKSFPPSDEIRAIAAEIRRRTADTTARFAVVVDGLLVVGMTNMILAQAGLMDRFETFSTEEEALSWIQNSH